MNKIIVAVGDVHGCFDEFIELLNIIQYNPSQMRLVLLGDLMDRGPQQAAVVAKVREMNVECVYGNHEDKHVRWRKHKIVQEKTGKLNPMKAMSELDSSEHDKLSDDDIAWMKRLPIKIDLGNNWWAVHAGMEPGLPFEEQVKAQILRVRYINSSGRGVPANPDHSQPDNTTYWSETWSGPQSIVYGHCIHSLSYPREDIAGDVYRIGLDTGCVFGGNLTAMLVDPTNPSARSFAQVKAKKIYYQGYDGKREE